MKKIKLFATKSSYLDDDYYSVLTHGLSDWEEVPDEDVKFIHDNLWRLSYRHPTGNIILVEQVQESSSEIISGIKETIKAEEKKEAQRKEKVRLLAEEKKQKALIAKSEKEKKKIEDMIKANPELVKTFLGSIIE
jgi:hypothetical protein